MPDGGAVVLMRTLQNAGSSSEVETSTLIGINKTGVKRWQVTLPLYGLSRASSANIDVVDVNGNVVVEDSYGELSNGNIITSKYFTVLDSITGGQRAGFSLSGAGIVDDYTGGERGYASIQSQTSSGDARLYVDVKAPWGSTNDGAHHLFAFTVPGLGLDYPRGVFLNATTTTQPPTTPTVHTFAAVGDSFISGEGDRNSGFNGGNCHRSTTAWPIRAANNKANNLKLVAFPACSGATTKDVLKGGTNQPLQITQIPAGTQEAAVSIGGNDVGFKDLIYACLFVDCANHKTATEKAIKQLSNADKLPAVYDQMRYVYAYGKKTSAKRIPELST